MPKLCERFNKFLKQHIVGRFLPITSIYWNQNIYNRQESNYNIFLPNIFIQTHQFYFKEFRITQIKNKNSIKQQRFFTKQESLTDLLPAINQQILFNQTFEQIEDSSKTTQIHTLQLLDKNNLETHFFSLDDIETTWSQFENDINYSFIDESIISTQ